MKQLTIRGLSPDLERRLRSVARRRGTSLNKAAVYLMGKGAGLPLPENQPDVVGSSLDALIGSWSAEAEAEFSAAVSAFSHVDGGFWQ